MKYFYLIIILFFAEITHADEIVLMNGDILRGKVKAVDIRFIFYTLNDIVRTQKNISRNAVGKIIYSDGTEVIIPESKVMEEAGDTLYETEDYVTEYENLLLIEKEPEFFSLYLFILQIVNQNIICKRN